MARRGTKGSYGHHSVAQMKRDKAKGGALGKKANFALSMRKIASRRKKRSGSRRRKRTARR
jgi:hypothetical protein